jgi:hypothetical protein
MSDQEHIREALEILHILGLPKAQHNERSALCLLAVLNLSSNKKWSQAENHMIGITPIMEWINTHYGKKYAPNSRETIRRQTMHQFMAAGLVTYNPDEPARAVNSPNVVYQVSSSTFDLLRSFNTRRWKTNLKTFLQAHGKLAERYARERKLTRISVKIASNKQITFSPGGHSELIKTLIEEFAPNFVPEGKLIYAGDTGEKWGYFDEDALTDLGVRIDSHGKMPDVVIHYSEKNWLILAEAVTSHGPVDGKRHEELLNLFKKSSAGLVFVTAFPNRAIAAKYLGEIAWETEVWIADSPSHLIHFNGERFLGPY